jgi:hypothetical protein
MLSGGGETQTASGLTCKEHSKNLKTHRCWTVVLKEEYNSGLIKRCLMWKGILRQTRGTRDVI